MNDFLEKMAEILEVETSELTEDMDFKSMQSWDSLAQLSVLALAQDDYSKAITIDDLKSAKSFKELYELVRA